MCNLLTPEERKNIIAAFLGWGDPERAKIVFIGYEPGGEFWTKKESKSESAQQRLEMADTRLRLYDDLPHNVVCWNSLAAEQQMTPEEYGRWVGDSPFNITNRIQCYLYYGFSQSSLAGGDRGFSI